MMNKSNIALGFYQNPETAGAVLKRLRKAGIRRSASIRRFPDKHFSINSYSPSPLLITLSFIIIVLWIIALFTGLPMSIIEFILLGFIGLASWWLIDFFYLKIDPDVLNRFKELIIGDETLVIAQISPKELRQALSVLRQVESGHPTSFLLRAEKFCLPAKEEIVKEPLTLEEMDKKATELALSLKHVGHKTLYKRSLLKALRESEHILKEIRENVGESKFVEQTVTTSAEWLLDNSYVIQGNIEEIYRNLPKKFYQELPKLLEGPYKGLPRVYVVAKELINSAANRLKQDNIIAFLKSYQAVDPLTIGELWALSLMLRFRLIESCQYLAIHIDRRLNEGEYASLWGNRLLNVARRDPDSLPHFLEILAKECPNPSEHFAEELLDHLFDEELVLPPLRKWFEGTFHGSISDIIHREQVDKSVEQVSFSNAVISLITLSQLSWQVIFEETSAVDQILNKDPSGVYLRMDFATRNRYRKSIETLSRHSTTSETQIARLALENSEHGKGEVENHVGYYLVDEGRPIIEKVIHYGPDFIHRVRRWVLDHPTLTYLSCVGTLTLLIEIGLFFLLEHFSTSGPLTVIYLTLALFPASEYSIQLINFIVSLLVPPHALPKLAFESQLPDDCKTLVIVPSMLSSEETIKDNISRLEIHYLANKDPALRFGLFVDYVDAPEAHMKEDQKRLDLATKGVKELEEKYGPNIFVLLHRERVWSRSENAWIGWERKRGKLECLNRLLTGKPSPDVSFKVGSKETLNNIRYVITLDSDTELPKDSAKQLIATIAHPLNTPRLSSEGNIERGYTIIQPRVSTNFIQAKHSYFTYIFSDETSVDPYCHAISNIYQDLMHEGTYHGKGIYDVHAFDTILSGRFPEEQILSHDLIEGCYAKVAFASDISLLDSFPEDYLTWSKRQHRWMRGDWQIADWLFSRAPNAKNQKTKNALSVIDRWKIFDNLRRALLPVSTFSLLVLAWLVSASPAFWTAFIVVMYFLPSILGFYYQMAGKAYGEFATTALRTIVTLAVLPHQAYSSLDALVRVLYRRHISHRRLLQWQTGYRSIKIQHKLFILKLLLVSILSIILLSAIESINPIALTPALPIALLWLLSPIIVYFLDEYSFQEPSEKISPNDQDFLRFLARKTWRYFEDYVGPQSNWLPPDNYQAALQVEIAQRTSPTNIGLWMVCALTAKDLHYITSDDVIDRISSTLHTIKRLELHEGHLLNWYDIQSLNPLYPRYVSTVDSGNLIASLWTLVQGLTELEAAPLLPLSLLDGLRDTFELICQQKSSTSFQRKLHNIQSILYRSPLNAFALIQAIHLASGVVQQLLAEEKIDNAECAYWTKQLEEQLQGWEAIISRYFTWLEILNGPSPSELQNIDSKLVSYRGVINKSPISFQKLASEHLPEELNLFLNILQEKASNSPEADLLLKRLRDAIQNAKWLAGEKLAQSQEIIDEINRLSDGMNMRFLYNRDRKLFSIGYHVEDCKLDNAYYDLLASEARIASLVSIAKGDVPLEHWWALGRSYNIVYGQKVLLSWGGTMFEYLMPLLFNHPHQDSLLGQACEAAVACQIQYGKQRGIPWGISEAAFSDIDIRKTYQYRSFGVPGLGFKRGLEEDLVVSPYSSALALAVKPNESISNLRLLSKDRYHLLSTCGFYESIDFSRQHGPHGERGVTVYAFMAHHEGMSLLAFNNVINDHIIPKRFHSDPRIAGVESLLCERVPATLPIGKGSRKDIPVARLTQFTSAPILGRMDTPQSTTPKVNLLSNGTYSIMVTNAGGGYSRWKGIDITRWYADTTRDHWGSYCYIKDVQTGAIWSTAYHPTLTKGKNYSVSFKADRVDIHRRDNDIETLTEIVVSPEDDAEIRMITLANLSKQTRHLELTSYNELALAPHATDRAHPAFNKLFIETEALPELNGILAFRRLRSPTDAPIWAAHVVASNQPPASPIQYETERPRFIGRGKSLQHPIALDGNLSNTVGTVLDPIFSLRFPLSLAPGQRVRIAFITAVADDRDKAVALVKKYGDLAASHRAIEIAWNHAQLELRHLRVHQEEVQLFQKLASRVLYPHSQLRPTTEQLRRNHLGQSSLWAYGISGDIPIVAVTVADFHDIDLVKQVLTAHAFWRQRGLQVDLVILNEEATGYEHPLFDHLQRIIASHSNHSDIAKSGGVFLINYDQIPETDLNLILACARANLIAARGSLRQQLVSPVEFITYPPRLQTDKTIKDVPSKTLPFLELSYFNDLGGFTPDGREYAIYLGPNANTPAPWINVIANSTFGTMVSEAGSGCTWYGNSQNNRLTPWSNDPLQNPITDCLYIRDDEMGTFWSPTPGPIRELDAYRVRHGQGYSRFEHNSHGIEQDLLIYVPVDDSGGLPVRIQKLRLVNNSGRPRRLSVFAFSTLVLGENREDSQMHVITQWDPESQSLFAYNRYHPDFGNCVAFVCSNPMPKSYTGNRAEFIGRNSSTSNPAALKRKGLAGTTGGGYDPCAALHVEIELAPNEESEIVFILGYAQDEASARDIILKCREKDFIQQAYLNTLNWWNKLLGTIQIETPDPDVNFAVNRWLLYQNLSCRYWGRSAFYQSSGAYGFRDQLQDVAALVYTAPAIARSHILRAASRQFVEGDVQHWWHASSKGGGVRTRISDDLLWLPFITAHYVRVTNDTSILDEVISFLKGDLLKPDQHEIFFIPEISEESGTLLEHCRRAIAKGITAGPHGLPLIGSGDWNDGMNRVGIEGKGESVWLAWFLIHVMNDFADLLSVSKQEGAAEGFRVQAKRLAAVVEEKAWDGNWYLRAFFDDGSPLGSKVCPEATIDSLAQSWAVISGAADPARADSALKSVEDHLIKKDAGMVLLLAPPFDVSLPDPGYIKGYPPGVRENGGQYTHGSLWVPMAFARKGKGDEAVNLLKMMHAIAHSKTAKDVQLFKVEPYVLTADIYSLAGQIGRGGWTWYTGSAGWMYRIWIEEIFGFTLRGNTLRLNPVLPASWDKVKLRYTHHNTPYEILIENPQHLPQGKTQIELDGNKIETTEIQLVDDSRPHIVKLTII